MATSTTTPDGGAEAAAADRGALTWPNAVTLARILLVPVLVGAFYLPGAAGYALAFGAFALAALSDFVDGWLARRLDQHSALGRALDPIADKLLVAAALVMLTAFERVPAVAAAAILAREFLVAGLREALAGRARLPVQPLAKGKTFAQMAAIALLLAVPAFPVAGDSVAALVSRAGEALLWLAVALTWITGIGYLRRAWRSLSG